MIETAIPNIQAGHQKPQDLLRFVLAEEPAGGARRQSQSSLRQFDPMTGRNTRSLMGSGHRRPTSDLADVPDRYLPERYLSERYLRGRYLRGRYLK